MFDIETKKTSQICDIPTKIIKENIAIFGDFLILIVPLNLVSVMSQICRCGENMRRKHAKEIYKPVSI